MISKKEQKDIAKSLSKTKKGIGRKDNGRSPGTPPTIFRYFGCLKCGWAGTKLCPHGIQIGGHHGNWICSHRVLYLKKQYEECGSVVRVVQQEELFKLRQISERMLFDYAEEGDLPDDFKHISKLIVSLTDKMRRQDEGLKIQGEISVITKEFKNVIDTQAELIKDKDIIKEAEFQDAHKSNSRGAKAEAGEKV